MNILTIAARELRSLFLSPLAWSILAVIQLLLGYLFLAQLEYFQILEPRIAALEERLFRAILPEEALDRVFDDQYIATGGQLFDLMTGRDRFVADIRPRLLDLGTEIGLCSHPYDLCTELIARQVGVQVTDLRGRPLRFPLDTTTPVGWAGYANQHIRDLVEPHLLKLLAEL